MLTSFKLSMMMISFSLSFGHLLDKSNGEITGNEGRKIDTDMQQRSLAGWKPVTLWFMVGEPAQL